MTPFHVDAILYTLSGSHGSVCTFVNRGTTMYHPHLLSYINSHWRHSRPLPFSMARPHNLRSYHYTALSNAYRTVSSTIILFCLHRFPLIHFLTFTFTFTLKSSLVALRNIPLEKNKKEKQKRSMKKAPSSLPHHKCFFLQSRFWDI